MMLYKWPYYLIFHLFVIYHTITTIHADVTYLPQLEDDTLVDQLVAIYGAIFLFLLQQLTSVTSVTSANCSCLILMHLFSFLFHSNWQRPLQEMD